MKGPAATGSLLERARELGRIQAALADARAGHGRFVVIEGPAGIGKTVLLSAALASAAEAGMRVLRSRGTELERDFAFGVVRQLFEPPLAEHSGLERADLLHGAAGVAAARLGLPGAPATDSPSPGVDPSFAILHGLYWLCANLSAAGPLCVAVDDAHWADAASLRYLAFLVTRLGELGVALLVVTRPREAGPDFRLLAAVTDDRAAEVVHLPPLTGAAVAQLVEAGLDRAADPVFVDACLRATGGTPLLMRLLVEGLEEDGIVPTAAGATRVESIGARTAGRWIRLRLGRLPEQTGRLARALAILEQGDLRTVAQLAELEEGDAAEAAELLTAAGLLEAGRPLMFVHPIVRSAVYEQLSGAARALGHRRSARLLAGQLDTEGRVAQHLLASEPAGDDWVVERLVEAASAAGKQGAPESQAVLLRRALAEPPKQGSRSALLLDLGMAEASAGLAGWGDHLQEAVDTAPDGVAAANAALVLSHALSRAQRFAEAVEVLDRTSSSLGRRHAELALLLDAAAVFPAMNDAATAASVSLRRKALDERAAESGSVPPELLAVSGFAAALTNGRSEGAADLATRALLTYSAAPTGSGGVPWYSVAGWFSQSTFTLLWSERYAQVRPLLDASIAQARATGDSSRLAMGLANRGWLALRRGDLSAAEADTRTALAATELPAPPMYRLLNGALLIETLVDQGKLEEAEQTLAAFDREVEGGSIVAAVLRFARGRLRAGQGRNAEALEDFLAVGADLRRALVTSPAYLPWRSEAALVELALGNLERAGRLADEELALARVFGAPRALGVAQRAAGIVAGGDRGEALLRESVRTLEQSDAVVERARALADLGALLRRRNRRTEARILLREALDTAHRAGARRLAEHAEIELRATGARPRRIVLTGLESLTASERRIAQLAGRGLTNREIAQSLFITTRTVEGHLTSVFRKLRVDSRDELPALLVGDALVPAY